MIISANRSSTMNGNYIIAANESYGIDDMGRILIENEMNDMAIFNAILKSDMHEIRAQQEGTLLESEIQALSENAVQDMFKAIIAKLKKFWAKMKGVFKKAYAMVSAYVVRNGKAFVAANKKAIANLSDTSVVKGEIFAPKNGLYKGDAVVGKLNIDTFVKVDGGAAEMAKAGLKACYGEFEGSLYDHLKKENFEKKTDPTLAQCGGKMALVTVLENGMATIKALQKTEKEAEKALKDSIKKLEAEAKSAAKKAEGEAKEAAQKDVTKYRNASTALTNCMSSVSRAQIRLAKFQLAQARIALARAIAGEVKMESALLESMILEAEEEIEDAISDDATPIENEAPETAEEILELVADALKDAAEEAGSEE